jgi:pSer/pThr/pTyr-binding forkhead associated (FHA) protein
VAPIVLPILQGLFLVLLYLFVWRIARAIIRDLRAASQPPRQAARQATAPGAPRPQQARRPAPTPQPVRTQPRELVIHRAGSPPKVLPLNGSEITFGRAAPATVVLDDPYVSDRHARIAHEGSIGWVVTDLGSTNGTFLNQVKVTRPTPIAPGDQLGIGKTTVEIRR